MLIRLGLLFLLLVGALTAADDVIVPVLPEPAVGANAPSLVFLPADHAVALRILHDWNAAMTATDRSDRRVPSIRELYSDTATATTSRWAQPDGTTVYAEMAPARIAVLHFDLRTDEGQSGYFVLRAAPGSFDALQRYVDDRSRALGLVPVRPEAEQQLSVSLSQGVGKIAANSGLARIKPLNYAMIGVSLLLLWLAIAKGFEPLLLIPIATGCIFVNAIGSGMAAPPTADSTGGMLYYFFTYGIETGIFPLLIFLGVGALTDFGPLLANPWSALLGAAAQFGIFGSFFMAAVVGELTGVFSLRDCAAIAIIGGADGPTSIYVASKLAPDLLGAIAVAAYSYMALVPIIQPPVMRALTSEHERTIMMQQAKPVSQRAKILFPICVTVLCLLTLPDAVPLIGMLMFGNLLRECGVADRLVKCAQNELINLVTICLGLAVGTKMSADQFLRPSTLMILGLGCAAFVIGTGAGVLFGRLMCRLTGGRVNPLIGAAGVSAVPMAARVVQGEGQRYNKQNFLLMHAMGPNVAGVVGSAVAAGILISLLG